MGRIAKPHQKITMKFDADVLQRLDALVDDVNANLSHHQTNRTEVMEILIEKCLLNYDDSMNYVCSQIIQIRTGR